MATKRPKPEPKRSPGRPRGATPPAKTRGVRLPDDVNERIDLAVRQANERDPYANANRTSVIVAALRAQLPPLPGGGA